MTSNRRGKSKIPVPQSNILREDDKWCISQGENLSFEIFGNHYKFMNKQKAHRRYSEILNNMHEAALKSKLLDEFEAWKSSSYMHEYWLNKALAKEELKTKNKVLKVVSAGVSSVVNEMSSNLGKRKPEDKDSEEEEDELKSLLEINKHDDVLVETLGKSVGSIIKHAALKLYGGWVYGDELSSYQRRTMNLGLSSILDTMDTSANGQSALFGDK
ncbi:hypothetical protein BDC45DRAFT_538530 [Circinella umbellata]|nr:hypothetical protein BDC45DRAFT_538530 [Circinella umbellata]